MPDRAAAAVRLRMEGPRSESGAGSTFTNVLRLRLTEFPIRRHHGRTLDAQWRWICPPMPLYHQLLGNSGPNLWYEFPTTEHSPGSCPAPRRHNGVRDPETSWGSANTVGEWQRCSVDELTPRQQAEKCGLTTVGSNAYMLGCEPIASSLNQATARITALRSARNTGDIVTGDSLCRHHTEVNTAQLCATEAVSAWSAVRPVLQTGAITSLPRTNLRSGTQFESLQNYGSSPPRSNGGSIEDARRCETRI